MRISDWSSDVCSSDLRLRRAGEREARRAVHAIVALNDVTARALQRSDRQWTRAKGFDTFCPVGAPAPAPEELGPLEIVTRVNRSEARRVGTERVRQCSARGSPSHVKKSKHPIP